DSTVLSLDAALGGLLSSAAAEEEFRGKDGQQLLFHTHGKTGGARVLLLGIGRPRNLDREREALRNAGSRAVKSARMTGAKALAIAWPLVDEPEQRTLQAQSLAEGAVLGAYRFDRYLKDKKTLKLQKLELIAQAPRDKKKALDVVALGRAAELGASIGSAVWLARDLVNEPAAKVTPRSLADTARAVAKSRGLTCEVRGRDEIAALGMQLFLGVAQGSVEEPQLVKLVYTPKGAAAKNKPIALVGKAVTFDSGGLSLKTAQGMEDMKVDMAGAAAVIAAMDLVAQQKPPFPVHGYFGACENMPSGTALRPGDVILGRGGLSVEVLNTDAEGRLVLADVLAWATDSEPAAIIDLATLTGAIMVALGPWIAGLFCNDDTLCAELTEAASAAGELVWRMPLPPEMEELIKSPIADLKNTGGRNGGAISAALFLQRFVGKIPWAHLDIAGPASLDKERGYNARGGTGSGVRLLAEWIARRAAET
ncbi:MAG: leucyl aminopeptidase, partial [Deltaproteobacteria bacterium]|nr:leucyl aminopeptidase [Deltaproteobacteria bacterium]